MLWCKFAAVISSAGQTLTVPRRLLFVDKTIICRDLRSEFPAPLCGWLKTCTSLLLDVSPPGDTHHQTDRCLKRQDLDTGRICPLHHLQKLDEGWSLGWRKPCVYRFHLIDKRAMVVRSRSCSLKLPLTIRRYATLDWSRNLARVCYWLCLYFEPNDASFYSRYVKLVK